MIDLFPAGGLGFQLSMDRIEDTLREARRSREGDALQAAYDQLLSIHNDLVQRYNALLGHAQRLEQAVQQRDARVQELEGQLAAALDEVNRGRRDAHAALCARMDLHAEIRRLTDLLKEQELRSQQG
jgi:hypothetical protein